ncbi:DUF4403 family protein [Mesorhizobium sp. M0091]|uniref:DUF4403 family protein n=1 Tax=Mesorhizobium sp. M0091 TaxID=2956875 RepID=UPI003334B8D0
MRNPANYRATIIATAFTLGLTGQLYGQEQATPSSYVTVPILANLPAIEERINAEVPDLLADLSQSNVICIPAQKAKYKYPCFRGIKIYSCEGWTYVSPEVKCDVSGWVKRNGRIRLSGAAGTLHVSFPIAAQVTAKAGVSETANAKATIIADITPIITPDWNVGAQVVPGFTWDMRPTLELFGFIKITIGDKVEPKLHDKLNELAAKLPALLADLKVRENVEKAWSSIQDPIKLSDNPVASLMFEPSLIGFSGISIEDKVLRTQVTMAGSTRLALGSITAPATKVPLPQLTSTPVGDGLFRFQLPIVVPYSEIIRAAQQKFPNGYKTELKDENFSGTLSLSSPAISRRDDGRLLIAIDLAYDDRSAWLRWIDYFSWFDTEGRVEFSALPVIDEQAKTLFVKELSIESDTNNQLVDTVTSIASLPLVRDYVASLSSYSYGDDLRKGVEHANKALNVDIADKVKLLGTMASAKVSNLDIAADHISLDANLEGQIRIEAGF